MNKLFEKWVIKQFGSKSSALLGREMDGAYTDETINAMWIGFNAGYELK